MTQLTKTNIFKILLWPNIMEANKKNINAN